MKTTYTIHCPSCHVDQSAELVDTINAADDLEERNALFTNHLNLFSCPNCHYSFLVTKPVLYCDILKNIFVYNLPVKEQESVESATRYFQSILSTILSGFPAAATTPDVQLTFERIEMIERILLCEAEYIPRIIEYIKMEIMTKNKKAVPAEDKRLLLNTQLCTDDALLFVIQDIDSGDLEREILYPRKNYTELKQRFDKDTETPGLLELFPGPYISARYTLLFTELFA